MPIHTKVLEPAESSATTRQRVPEWQETYDRR